MYSTNVIGLWINIQAIKLYFYSPGMKNLQIKLIKQSIYNRNTNTHLTEGCKSYTEHFKTFSKEIKEIINKWIKIPCLWIQRFNVVKMVVFLKCIYRLYVISFKTPASFFFLQVFTS